MMRLARALLLVLLCGAPLGAAAQTAETYFHEGAQAFVQGEREAAEQAVENGLQIAPNDPRLLALREQLQAPPPQRGSAGQNEQQNEGEQDDSSQSSDGDTQDQQSPPEQSDQEEPQSPEEQRPDEQKENPADDPREQEGQALERPQELTQEEARRMLQALRYNEMRLLKQRQNQTTSPPPSGKDW